MQSHARSVDVQTSILLSKIHNRTQQVAEHQRDAKLATMLVRSNAAELAALESMLDKKQSEGKQRGEYEVYSSHVAKGESFSASDFDQQLQRLTQKFEASMVSQAARVKHKRDMIERYRRAQTCLAVGLWVCFFLLAYQSKC